MRSTTPCRGSSGCPELRAGCCGIVQMYASSSPSSKCMGHLTGLSSWRPRLTAIASLSSRSFCPQVEYPVLIVSLNSKLSSRFRRSISIVRPRQLLASKARSKFSNLFIIQFLKQRWWDIKGMTRLQNREIYC